MESHLRAAAGLAALVLTLAGGTGEAGAAGSGTGRTAVFSDFAYQGRSAGGSAGPGRYANPILAGFYPDPSITRRGDDFYLVNSSFAYFPGLPVFHSRDLVNWTQVGNAIDRPTQLRFDGLGVSRGVFAPDLSYHDGLFYILNTCVDCGGNYLITAKDPAGPWSDPQWLGFDGIDPSLFVDDDGRAYILNNGPPEGAPLYDGHRAIWLQAFDLKTRTLTGPRSVIVNGGTDLAAHPRWIEGPHLFKHDGRYMLIAAEGGTADQHSAVAFRADRVDGPYTPYPGNPILTQRGLAEHRPDPITSAGHAEFVQTPGGQWWSTFLATQPYGDDLYNTGRETFLLPVHWTAEGWPQVTTPGQAIAHAPPRPDLPPQPAPPTPSSGSFKIEDRFPGDRLGLSWLFIRTPHERWWHVGGGRLTLDARADALGGLGQPSFVGHRQQHANASATVTVRYSPGAPGDEAGLAAFQDEAHYYLIAVTGEGAARAVTVERRAGKADPALGVQVASGPLSGPPGQPVRLRITARGGRYDFAYAQGAGGWRTLLADADGTILSTKVAGGFTGALFGLYAHAR